MDDGYYVVAVVLFAIFLAWTGMHLARSVRESLSVRPVDDLTDEDLTDRERALVRKFCTELRYSQGRS